MTVALYRIYCVTSAQHECVWDTAAPTTCPVDGGHTVTASTVSVVEPELLNAPDPSDLAPYEDLSLAEYKLVKNAAIDRRTDELIVVGFEHPDASGKYLSLSKNAQAKAEQLHTQRSHGSMSYPIVINTLDDTDTTSLANAAAVVTFHYDMTDTIRTHIDSGTTLKTSVRSAANKAAVDAVTDSR